MTEETLDKATELRKQIVYLEVLIKLLNDAEIGYTNEPTQYAIKDPCTLRYRKDKWQLKAEHITLIRDALEGERARLIDKFSKL